MRLESFALLKKKSAYKRLRCNICALNRDSRLRRYSVQTTAQHISRAFLAKAQRRRQIEEAGQDLEVSCKILGMGRGEEGTLLIHGELETEICVEEKSRVLYLAQDVSV